MRLLSEENYIQQVSIDCVIFGFSDKKLKVLVPKLIFNGDFWALPSGFVFQDEDIDQAAARILLERTSIGNICLEQFQVMGKAGRSNKAFLDKLIQLNPQLSENDTKSVDKPHFRREYEWFTKRFITIGYYALVDISRVVARKSEIDQSIEWYDYDQLPPLIMDHREIIEKALETFRQTAWQRSNVFNLLPETFTMKDAQELFETIFRQPFARNNFQKKILDMNVLERLEKKYTGAANKAPYLYRIAEKAGVAG